METLKVDIKTEMIAIPDGHQYWVTREYNTPMALASVDASDPSSMMVEERENRYVVNRIQDAEGKMKLYLVRCDQNDLFTELVEITDSMLQSRVYKETEKIRRDWEYDVITQKNMLRKRIKNLSWWKRLFNKF